MRLVSLAIRLLGVCLLIGGPGTRVYLSWKIDQAVASLKLADDASTPALKAKFLWRFMAEMDDQKLPSHGAWVFATPRNSTAEQRRVLQSLAERCEDLAKVDPSSLGYAQGMQQITGQEFKHVLNEINDIYRTALWIRFGWWAWCVQWGVFILVPLGLILTVWGGLPLGRRLRKGVQSVRRSTGLTVLGFFIGFILVVHLLSRIPGC